MPESFPTITQYASPELIEAMAYRGHDPADDPRWPETGAPDHATYLRWCGHMCGIACLRMALLHHHGQAPDMFTLLDGALRHGAYTVEDDGTIRGLVYAPAATYVRAEHGLAVDVHGTLPMSQLLELLDEGRMVVASVHKEIRRPHRPAPGRGGHLVLVTGRKGDTIYFRNPSGHTPDTRDVELAVDVFTTFYAERGMSIAPPTNPGETT